MKSFAKPLAAFAMLVAGATGAVADAWDSIQANKVVRIAIDPAAPPYSAMDPNGQFAGFEVDVARRLAEDWGVELQIVPSTPANRIPYLITGQADLVISTLSITDERRKVIAFSRPYSGIQIAVNASDAAGIETLEDLVGKPVAVVRGSTNDDVLTAEALPGTDILRFEDDATAITAMLSGQAQAYVTAPALITSIQEKNPDLNMAPRIILRTNLTGIGVRQGEDALVAQLDTWVAARLEDGFLQDLYQAKFGLDLPEAVFDPQ